MQMFFIFYLSKGEITVTFYAKRESEGSEQVGKDRGEKKRKRIEREKRLYIKVGKSQPLKK